MSSHPSPANSDIATAAVEYGNVRIQYRTCGSGPRVLLLPSVGRDVEDFYPVAHLLAARGCRAIMPTPRGMGDSTGPLENISLHDLARDVIAVLEHDGGSAAVVAGHAFGNWIARVAALQYPEQVKGVVVLAAAHKNFPPELRDHIDKCMDQTLPQDERLHYVQATFFSPGHDASAWLEGWHPHVAQAQRRASAATPSGWWTAGRVPVLDVQAENDVFAPRAGAHLLQAELGADRVSIVVIPEAAHALLPEQPEAVAVALETFTKDVMN